MSEGADPGHTGGRETRPCRVLQVGLACCAVEAAAARIAPTALRGGGDATGEVFVVAGTLTDAMAPLVVAEYRRRLAEAGPGLRVVSFGSCANTGGPYWDSYAVTKGVDQLIPVDVAVPGCPPRPEALASALDALDGDDRGGRDGQARPKPEAGA